MYWILNDICKDHTGWLICLNCRHYCFNIYIITIAPYNISCEFVYNENLQKRKKIDSQTLVGCCDKFAEDFAYYNLPRLNDYKIELDYKSMIWCDIDTKMIEFAQDVMEQITRENLLQYKNAASFDD